MMKRTMGVMSVAVWVMMFMALSVSSGYAAETILGLKKNAYYDVYTGGQDATSVIKNVQIVETREFNGRVYLVIRADSFGRGSEGLVQMDYVRAILPSLKFTNLPVHPKIPRR